MLTAGVGTSYHRHQLQDVLTERALLQMGEHCATLEGGMVAA